jgi:hypothetical protein
MTGGHDENGNEDERMEAAAEAKQRKDEKKKEAAEKKFVTKFGGNHASMLRVVKYYIQLGTNTEM